MTTEELKSIAALVATELKAAGETITPDLRQDFIDVRAELFHRGIFDPVLVRFDSFTAPKASLPEIAEQLATVAEAL